MPQYPRGITGPDRWRSPDLPPGQYATTDFPIVSTQPPPLVRTAEWTLTLTTQDGLQRIWGWSAFRALPVETFSADLHAAHGWSKLATNWTGVPLRTLLEGVDLKAEFAHIASYGDYATTVPVEDLVEMPTWIALRYKGRPISVAHGGPARMLIPHLYLFKSAKWVRAITLSDHDQPGTRERDGVHHYGDPWREQRRQES